MTLDRDEAVEFTWSNFGGRSCSCRNGFAAESLAVEVRADADQAITVQLQDEAIESQVVVVTATRSGTVIGDQPIRVEAVPEEEIEET